MCAKFSAGIYDEFIYREIGAKKMSMLGANDIQQFDANEILIFFLIGDNVIRLL